MRRPAPRVPALVNLALLALFPVAWVAPLAEAGMMTWLFSGRTITVLGGVRDLWPSDPALALLVGLFAVVIPYAKSAVLAAIQFGVIGRGLLPVVEALGKLSMADVFLIALYIVLSRGVGVGEVTTAWGLWLFTACVLAQIWVGWATARRV